MTQRQARALVRAAERDRSSVGAIYRGRRQVSRVFLVGVIVLAASSISVVAIELVYRRIGNEITPGLFAFVDVLLLILIPGFVAMFVSDIDFTRKFFTSLWALRQAARGDDDLMAPVAPQPQPMSSEDEQSGAQSFAHIRWLDDPIASRLLIRHRLVSFGLLPIYFSSFFWLMPLFFRITLDSYPPTQYFYVFSFLPVLVYAMVFVSLIFGRRTVSIHRKGILVRADEQGLTWRHAQSGAREIRIAWSELRSFVQVGFLTPPAYMGQKRGMMFLLDAGAAILAWGYEPMRALYGESMSDDTPDLVRLIVTHASLPLRDATPLVAEVAGTASAMDAAYWRQILAPKKVARSAATIAGLDDVLRPPRAERLRAWIPVWLAFIPLVAYIIISVFMATHP